MNKPFRKTVLCATAVAMMMGSAWAHEPGRMTGGGSFVCSGLYSGSQKVTHGFELHCLDDPPATLAEPNNLEINFSGGDNFHLTTLTKAVCTDDQNIQQKPPTAPFDTFDGGGTGTFNGQPAAITFTFTDAGEPGTADTALIVITQAGQTVLSCGTAPLTNGNHQAHKETGKP